MRNNKKTTILLALCLMLTVFLSLCLIACNSLLTSTPPASKTQVATSFVSIDVNPSIELVLDQNGIVMSASGANHDGKLLLFEEDGIVGAQLDVAVGNVATLCAKYGFLKEGENVISVSAVSNLDSGALLQEISQSFKKSAQNANEKVFTTVQTAVDVVLEEELASLKAQYPNNDSVQSLDVSRLRLVKSALDDGQSVVDASSQTLSSLLDSALEKQTDVSAKFDSSYTSLVDKAQYLCDSACATLENGVWALYYADKLLSGFSLNGDILSKTVCSLEYTLASASRLALEYFKTSLDAFNANKTYVVPSENIEQISSSLGVTFDEFVAKTHATVKDETISFAQKDFTSFVNNVHRNAGDCAQDIQSAYMSATRMLASFEANSVTIEDIKAQLEEIGSSLVDKLPLLSQFVDSLGIPTTSDLIEKYLADIDFDNRNDVTSAITRLEQTMQSLKATLDKDLDRDDFNAFVQTYGLQEKVAQIRNGLTKTLAKIKQNVTSLFASEKSSLLEI